MRPRTILKDKDFLVLAKPSGWTVYPESADVPSLTPWAQEELGIEVFPVHRLDRATEGLILFARSKEMASRFQMLFKKKSLKKLYLAICKGKLERKVIERSPIRHKKETKSAETRINPLDWTRNLTLVECEPVTGRYHQIRTHLFRLGHPILGDDEKIFLSAIKLDFTHPRTGKTVSVSNKESSLVYKKWSRIKRFGVRVI
jgi:23S rRNA-/tRNA-specific pseudouridylate synthase